MSATGSGALPIRSIEKPWGREQLPPPFDGTPGKRIGEIWFEPPLELPSLLVKYIFTSEKLSVQVHPNDDRRALPGMPTAAAAAARRSAGW